MSRGSQKRSYDDTLSQPDSEFGQYSRLLSYEDLRYLNDGVPQPGFLRGRVVGVNFANDVFGVRLEMEDGHSLGLRFEGNFALRMQRIVEYGSNVRISTRGAAVKHGPTTTVRYTTGAHITVETTFNAWEDQGDSLVVYSRSAALTRK